MPRTKRPALTKAISVILETDRDIIAKVRENIKIEKEQGPRAKVYPSSTGKQVTYRQYFANATKGEKMVTIDRITDWDKEGEKEIIGLYGQKWFDVMKPYKGKVVKVHVTATTEEIDPYAEYDVWGPGKKEQMFRTFGQWLKSES